MYEAIRDFHQQFLYEPIIENSHNFIKKSNFLVVGMGGSAHAPKLLKTYKSKLDIIIHQDYGLLLINTEQLKNRLIILSSYSGNTEEVLEAFTQAKSQNLAMIVIAAGGKLLTLAKENNIPYIQIPNTGIQPRAALGFSIKAFLKIINEEELKKITELAKTLHPFDLEKKGKDLAAKLKNRVPIIYASNKNTSLAELWKIKINETGKIPAFYNVLPELNHNEMTGFDVKDSTKELNSKFYFIILRDISDNSKILKRMEVLEKLYKNRNFPVEIIEMSGEDIWPKLFSSLVLADWTAYHTALLYGLEPEQVPMVEEFKKLI